MKLPRAELALRLVAAQDELRALQGEHGALKAKHEILLRDLARGEGERDRKMEGMHAAVCQAIRDLRQAVEETGGKVEELESD